MHKRLCFRLTTFARTGTKLVCGFLLWRALLAGSTALAQSGSATINPISYFQVQEGTNLVTWSQTTTSVDPATGNSIVNYADGLGGRATMTWLSNSSVATSGPSGSGNAATLVNWTLTPASGSPEVYADGASQGQTGSFVLASGTFGTNNVLSINGNAYVANGTILQPVQPGSPLITSFTYGGATYTGVSYGVDYSGRCIDYFSNGVSRATMVELQGAIYLANGTVADYSVDPTLSIYTYQSDSTAPNQLTQLNGCSLLLNGNVCALPIPQSFTWNGTSFTFSGAWYNGGWLNSPNISFSLYYQSNGGFVQAELDSAQIAITDGQGNTAIIEPYGTVNQTPGGPQAYQIDSSSGNSQFTAFNGLPYTTVGALLVPQGSLQPAPVNSFTYGGNTYQSTGSYSQASDGNLLATYQTSGVNPATATLEYSPTGALVTLSVNPSSGGTATYVNGASVGQPGAFVWSNTSTAANLLTAVNSSNYSPSGNSVLPGSVQTVNGVFQIEGNFMSLGSWASNPNQAGFNLSYYDGQSTAPSSIEFTASQPSTNWLWDVASANGTLVIPAMQLDQNSRLLLYAPDAVATAGAAGPVPSVILDPSATNPSDFAGVVRFEGPVRISPQGDLSMGTFTHDAFPAQPTQ